MSVGLNCPATNLQSRAESHGSDKPHWQTNLKLKVRAAGGEAEGSPGEPVDGIDARRTQRMQYKMALSSV